MRYALPCAGIAALALASTPCLSQTITAYQSGLQLAQGRGYANAGCYAQVFARHAVVVEKIGGRRNWFAPSTPAYNAELQRRCGVDRLADLANRQQARQPAFTNRGGGGIHVAGMKVARERGYSGGAAACFARIYTTFASPYPSTTGAATYAIAGASMNTYSAELFRQCGISR